MYSRRMYLIFSIVTMPQSVVLHPSLSQMRFVFGSYLQYSSIRHEVQWIKNELHSGSNGVVHSDGIYICPQSVTIDQNLIDYQQSTIGDKYFV